MSLDYKLPSNTTTIFEDKQNYRKNTQRGTIIKGGQTDISQFFK
ncbi:MAG: hypothetical protein ACXW07_09105 [Nitrososphaeraceae archaeon]